MSQLDSSNSGGKKPSVLNQFFYGNRFCWLSLICSVGLMMLVLFCFDALPFGNITILRMDLYHQYGPLFAELYDRITGMKSLLYSWQTGLGSPFLGNFFNYLSSPSMIFMLLFGHTNMPEAIAAMIISKTAFASAAFCYYLKKSQGKHDFTTAAFGLLYGMCGYFVAYYWNVMWIDAMVIFPFVILGIEKIINEYKPLTYVLSLAFILLTSYYMGYMACIFSVLYFIVYYFSKCNIFDTDSCAPHTLDANGKPVYKPITRLRYSKFIKSGLMFAFASFLGACLVAAALIPVYFILKNCSATSGVFPEEWTSYFKIYDFLSNHLASVDPTIRSSGSEVLPNVYCGMATLILVPLYLYTKSISIKEKVSYCALLLVLYFSFNLNVLNYIWHGFHFPNDLPYRFSFMYSFILLIIAYKAFTRLKEFTGKEILTVSIAIISAIILIEKLGAKNVDDNTVIISIAFIATYCFVFVITRSESYQRSAVSVLLLCCVVGELACANTGRYSMSQVKDTFTGDYEEFTEVKKQLDELYGDDSYRMELTYNRARMDPAWFGYNGISTFTSMAYEKVANLQSDLGVYGNYINSYTYYLQTPVYNMMHALKYIVDNSDNATPESDYYTTLMSSSGEKFTAYQNKYYLPIAFTVNSDVEGWTHDRSGNPFDIQSDWVMRSTGVKDIYSMMDYEIGGYWNIDPITTGLDTGELYYTKTSEDYEGEFTVSLTSEQQRHCYLFVDTQSFESIQIFKNGNTYTQNVDEPYIFDLGICSSDDDVSVLININSEHNYGYITFYPYYIDDEKLDTAYAALQKGQMNITSYDDTVITGTVSADDDCLLYTSIPYDKGWQVTVDGKKAGADDVINLADAYLAVKLGKGEHTVEFRYVPQGLIEGLAISALGITILLIWLLLLKRIKVEKEINSILTQASAAAQQKLDDAMAPCSLPQDVTQDISFNTTPEEDDEPSELDSVFPPEDAEAEAPSDAESETPAEPTQDESDGAASDGSENNN